MDPLETNASSLENAFKEAASPSPNDVPHHALLKVLELPEAANTFIF
jgi:hypothetical protein